LDRLKPAQRRLLLSEPDTLVAAAQTRSPEAFQDHVRRAVEHIEQVSGIERLAQQRRQVTARSWVFGLAATNLLRRDDTSPAGAPTGPPRADVVACIDPSTGAPDGPHGEGGLPVELPHEVLVKLYPSARVWPVVGLDGIVLYAAGRLDVGRATRIASQAQRRVLRGLYRSCAVPECASSTARSITSCGGKKAVRPIFTIWSRCASSITTRSTTTAGS
jgi:hypothetical protein